jgi:hypothetical protein
MTILKAMTFLPMSLDPLFFLEMCPISYFDSVFSKQFEKKNDT